MKLKIALCSLVATIVLSLAAIPAFAADTESL